MQPETNSDASQNLSSSREPRTPADERLELFEKRQQELWRLTFFVLFLVSAVFAWMSWDWLRSTKFHLEALPIGLVVLVALLPCWCSGREGGASPLGREEVLQKEHRLRGGRRSLFLGHVEGENGGVAGAALNISIPRERASRTGTSWHE